MTRNVGVHDDMTWMFTVHERRRTRENDNREKQQRDECDSNGTGAERRTRLIGVAFIKHGIHYANVGNNCRVFGSEPTERSDGAISLRIIIVRVHKTKQKGKRIARVHTLLRGNKYQIRILSAVRNKSTAVLLTVCRDRKGPTAFVNLLNIIARTDTIRGRSFRASSVRPSRAVIVVAAIPTERVFRWRVTTSVEHENRYIYFTI